MPPTRPDAGLDADDPRERARLLGEIRELSGRLGRLGVSFPSLRETVRAIAVSQTDGKAGIPTDVLESSRRELAATLRGFRGRERSRGEKVSNLRKAFYAAALVALLGGAITQKVCDPIGKVHAYLTTPPEEPETAP